MSARDGGPAFPYYMPPQVVGAVLCEGMSLRDYFAAKAMQAIVIGNDADECVMGAGMAADAYAIADAMLAAREKQP